MALTLNKPYSGLRIASSSNVPVFAPREGFCDDIVLDTPYVGLRASAVDGSPVFLISDQKTTPGGELEIGKPYIGLRASQVDGTLVYLVDGKVCEEGDPTVCGVTRCCTLEGSVRVKLTDDPTWSDWAPVDLVCGSTSKSSWWWCCLNDLIEDDTYCYYITWTASEKDTLSSPEAYTDGGNSGTRSCKTVIWSVQFDLSGETYRLTYYVVEWHVFQTLPTVITTDGCEEGYSLQRLDTDVSGSYWNLLVGTELHEACYTGGGNFEMWMINISNDSPDDPAFCPEGYGNSGAELFPYGLGCFPLTGACAEIDIIDPCNEDEDLV